MKTRDLFTLILKIFGLIIIKEILFQIPYLINPILYIIQSDSESVGLGVLIFTYCIFGLYVSVAYLLLFKTNKILNLFKFDDAFFETDLNFAISKINTINIGLVIVSGYILIEEIPNLCNHLYNLYEYKQLRFTETKIPTSKIIISASKIVLALLIIGEREALIKLILKEKVAKAEDGDQI